MDPNAVDVALAQWQEGLSVHPNSPSILLRLTRGHALRGMHTHPVGQDDLLTAKEYGVQCMRTESSVAGLMLSYGRLEPHSIAQSTKAACLAWTSMAWGRWLLAHGVAGAAIDLPQIEALARRAVALRKDAEGGLPLHALGLALAMPPEPLGPDFEAAEDALLQAQQLSPERRQVAVDLAVLVYGPQAQRATEFQTTLSAVLGEEESTTPEAYWNQGAREEAAAALEEGMLPRWRDQL